MYTCIVGRLSTVLFVCFISLFSYAIIPPPNNAVSVSLGGASSCYRNAFAIENNVAVLAFSDNQLALNGNNRFGLGDYSSLALAGNVNTKLAAIGLSYQIAPFGNLTTQKTGIGIAKKLGENISAGIALNYHTLNSTDAYYQSTNYLTVSAGIYYKINDKLNTGFQFTNPNRSRITSSPEEHSIALYRLGFEYAVTSDLALYTDFLQATEEPLDLNAGIEIKKEKYAIRGGFGLNQLVAIGFGWQTNTLHIDIAGSFHNQLGFSPSLNIGYAF